MKEKLTFAKSVNCKIGTLLFFSVIDSGDGSKYLELELESRFFRSLTASSSLIESKSINLFLKNSVKIDSSKKVSSLMFYGYFS